MINKDELFKFWEVIKPVKRTDYLEIRLAANQFPNKSDYYNKLKVFKSIHPDIIVKKGIQFFIKTFEELLCIVEFDNGSFSKYMKICYGLNLRNAKSPELLDGSYNCVKQGRFLFLDIESSSHGDITQENQAILDYYVKTITNFLYKYNLKNPIVIHSGAGRHVLYKISYFTISPAKKRGYKCFIKFLQERFKDSRFIIDDIWDFTRVFGLPETFNLKRNAKVKILSMPENVKNEFKIKIKKEKKLKKVDIDTDLPELNESLEWQLMIHPDLPVGDIHSTLLFALKLFMKKKGILDYKNLEYEMNSVRGSKHNLNPLVGTQEKEYSKGIVINWAKKHYDWIAKHPDLLQKYIEYASEGIDPYTF